MTAREIAIAAFYADSHPLMDKFVAEHRPDANEDGYGCDLSEVIAFAEALPPTELANLE